MKIFTLRHSWPVILEAKRYLATCCLSRVIPFGEKPFFVMILLALAMFTACDSGSSSADPDPIAEVSSSSGDDDAISSSSVTDKGKSSSGSSKSSSSVKPDSNGSQKSSSSSEKRNNSSSSEGGAVSSSSSDSEIICNDGDLDTLHSGLYIIYRKCENGTWVKDHYDVLPASSSSSSDAHYDMTKQYLYQGKENTEKMTDDFVDPRDQHVYKTFLYQKEKNGEFLYRFRIFASNLNYGKQIMSDVVNSDDNVVEKYCYNDDEWYCDNGFGGMYTWSEAMGLPKACDSLYVDSSSACVDNFVPSEGHSLKLGVYVQRQGICPKGWHVMNASEWMQFRDVLSTGLSSSVIWHGSNGTGFSALPVGWLDKGEYKYFGEWADFHEPQEFNHEGAKSHYIVDDGHKESNSRKDYASSVRCVEDYNQSLWE